MTNYPLILEIVIIAFGILFSIMMILVLAYHHVFSSLRKRYRDLNNQQLRLQAKYEEEVLKLKRITQVNSYKLNYINAIFSSIKDGMVLFDSNDRLVLMNPQAQQFLNLENDVFFEEEHSGGNDLFNRVRHFVDLVKDDESISETINCDNHFYDVYISRIFDKYAHNSLLGILVLISDVTQQFKIETLRKEFIQNVSHEFRTPLTIISGNIETLSMWEDIDQEYRNSSFAIINFEIERLKSILEQMLQLTRANDSSTVVEEKINLHDVIQEIMPSYQQLSKYKNIRFRITNSLSNEFGIVYGNKALLRQAISNLIENAIKYTVNEDTVLINIKEESHDILKLEVEDHGPGIALENYEKIFERFYRIDDHRNSKTGGSGLGLAISKAVVESMNGHIYVSSIQNKATRFIVEFPLVNRG